MMGSTATAYSHALALATFALAAAGCAANDQPKVDSAALASFAVASLPDDAKPTLFDFGSKVHIVGTSVSPEGTAGPGSPVKLKLYWERVAPLDPGWNLFTHIEDDSGKQLRNFDREGGFRGAVAGKPEGLAQLELGKIYVDEQTLEVPKADEATPKISIIVGVWNDSMRLPVVSGLTNGHDAALIAHLETGVPRRIRTPEAQNADRKKDPSR